MLVVVGGSRGCCVLQVAVTGHPQTGEKRHAAACTLAKLVRALCALCRKGSSLLQYFCRLSPSAALR